MKVIATLVFAAASMVSLSASALTASDLYGSAATPGFTTRHISIDSGTRYVNVNHGDVVTFSNGTDSVTWYFDGINSAFPLSKILPGAAGAMSINVYVQPEALG